MLYRQFGEDRGAGGDSGLKIILTSLFGILISVPVVLAICGLSAHYFDPLPQAALPAAEDFALDHVNLVPISEAGILADRQLLIRQGRIAAINEADTPVPPGLAVIDAAGAYVTPGFFDMHVHLDDPGQLQQALSYGVTSLRNMDGLPMHLRWKQQLQQGGWPGSRLYVASPAMKSGMFGSVLDAVVASPAHATALVDLYAQRGYDLVKVYSGLSVAEFNAIDAAAKQHGIAVAGHIPHAVVKNDYSRAAAMASLEHVEEIFQGPLNYHYDEAVLSDALATLVSARARLCPTLVVFEQLVLLAEGKQAYVASLDTSSKTPFGLMLSMNTDVNHWMNAEVELTRNVRAEFSQLQTILQQVEAAGVPLVTGTDAGILLLPIGPSLSREFALMSDSGISAQSILRAATLNAAESLRVAQDYGSIEIGKVADLVLLSGNPLVDISVTAEPQAVVKDGVFLGHNVLQRLRTDARQVAGWWISTGRYLEALWDRFWLRQLA